MTVAGVAGAAAQAQAANKKEAVHSDFYRFQQREKRRNGEQPCVQCSAAEQSLCAFLLQSLLPGNGPT